jgi:cyclophilin family peptidyl-prolyl cis-trans isomerase
MGDGWGRGKSIVLAVCAATAVGGLLAIASGCGGGDERSSAGTGASAAGGTGPLLGTKANTTAADTSKCKRVKKPKFEPATYEAPEQTVRKGEKLTAIVETTCGAFEIELETKRSPTTVNSFVFLARKGFYEGVAFDEAAPGTYLHGGDPPGKAIGPGYSVKGEVPEGIIYRHRVVAMAQPAEGTIGAAGSQFFIVLLKPWIDHVPTAPPLGKVSNGFGVLRRINALGPPDRYPGPSNAGVVGTIGKLKRPVLIERISIEKG